MDDDIDVTTVHVLCIIQSTYILLGCERGRKYKKYKVDLQHSITGTRKCDCPFKLRGKLVGSGKGWVLK